jgi:major type 1 subunit fimbrin (pilin)
MKQLNTMAMAFALAGFASSVFAGTATDNANASALHSSTTVHFNGLVEPATCSFQGKSMKVMLPTASVSNFDGLAFKQPAKNVQNKDFQLHIKCDEGISSDRMAMKISGRTNGNILENTHGTAKGVGLLLLNGSGNELPIGSELNSKTSGLENAFLNSSNTLDLKAEYVRNSGDVTAGTLATDAVFEVYYK